MCVLTVKLALLTVELALTQIKCKTLKLDTNSKWHILPCKSVHSQVGKIFLVYVWYVAFWP